MAASADTTDPLADDPSRLTVVAFAETSPELVAVGIRSVLAATAFDVVVGILYPSYAAELDGLGPRVTVRPVGSISQLVNETFAQRRSHIAVLHDVALLPPAAFDTALAWLRDDVRIASVSFLSNAAELLSFPDRDRPTTRPPDGHDEATLTRALRACSPPATPVPIPYAVGSIVVLGAAALGAVGDLVAPASARFDVAVADFSARARAKGFVDVADTSTYLWRPSDVAIRPLDDTLTFDDRGWLLHRHRTLVGFVDEERRATDSPLAIAHRVARAKALGLRIVVDGSCFGPNQVGTQVASAHTIRALASHPEVASVAVLLPGQLPSYSAAHFDHPRITALASAVHDPQGVAAASGGFDIAFRPYQPTPGWDVGAWRAAAPRLVISVLDTIAYNNGGYFETGEQWRAYRDHLRECVHAADAVTVISEDVIGQMRLHGFPIADTRLHAIPLGADHLRGDEPTRLPNELAARGFTAGAFAVCLGVNYTHKNRELAMAAHEIVRAAGHDLALVFAGASVPYGTTRLAESRQGVHDHVFVLPELADEEKNWLLRHAALVWYPTSAEGFGLVPFEAAAFATPTVAVDFGPLHELLRGDTDLPRVRGELGDDVPVLAPGWSASALAETALALLGDPGLAARHTEAIRQAAARYSWDRTASSLVGLFRNVLALPRR